MTRPELIEAMARAIYERVNGAGCRPWRQIDHKAAYRDQANAALAAIEARAPIRDTTSAPTIEGGETDHDPETGEIIQSQNPSGAASAPTSAAGEPPQASQPAAGTQETGLPPGPSPASENPIVATARDKAKQGLARLNMWMKTLSEADEAALADVRGDLFEAAKAADAAKKG